MDSYVTRFWSLHALAAMLMLTLLAFAHPSPPTSITRPTATIDSGVVIGATTMLPEAKTEVDKFLGIPYSSPTGRWALPHEVDAWHKPLNASAIGPICVQAWNYNALGPDENDMKALFDQDPPEESEDCLTVNIFAPSSPGPPHRKGRAVVVFIHGGGFQLGGSNLYDCSAFTAYEDIVAVTFNYRTNIFGFPASPAIPLKQRNLGLLDQLFALDWVRRNIHAFGGDPALVTVCGVSSGAESIDAHMLTHGSPSKPKPPFRGAILESGLSSLGFLSFRPPDNNLANWNRMLQATNCSSTSDKSALDCLSRVAASTLKTIMEANRIDFPPITDNVTVPASPGAIRPTGNFAKVPVLIGTVAEEGRSLINHNISMQDFKHAFLNDALFPNGTADAIVASYPRTAEMTGFDVGAAIFTDFLYQCPTAMLSYQTIDNGVSTWRYYLNVSLPAFLPAQLTWLRKYHGVEYYLLFTNPEDKRHTLQTRGLAGFMRSAFARFVKDPVGGPGWSPAGTGGVAVLGDVAGSKTSGGTVVSEKALDEKCPLFQGVLDGMAGLPIS
ncbi:Alpha/Beta hydrolase protein [Lasiosphaeris hirsuta]|uniref:Carboxylic ester hydrolase n=1 Tax=Lasiosphaeris hirsuta TaxID=260670 RepID=A0AA40B012_9PEZI|nr:Alpha/Beta hydrolase protein [Lasiosphaeris hirsuta]